MNDALLIADDDPDVISALRYLLQTEGYAVTAVGSPREVINAVKTRQFDAVIMDLNYSKDTTSGHEGLDLIQQLREFDPALAIIAMTAWGSIETAVAAMQNGARDFIQKPWENERLLSVLANQIRLRKSEQQTSKLTEENKILRHEGDVAGTDVFCRSAAMMQTMARLEQVARTDANLLLTGENGTGKSFLAQRVHDLSARSEGPLIKVNMGAITETLFESEMFGHVKGAFTDARESRMGRFELAAGGTLFLDEIGNTPYSQQAKLLRVLEDHRFERVGSMQTQVADCRLVSATNCDLDTAVSEGRFRQDLLYRINTVIIEVPPLRERVEDIVPFAEFVLDSLRRKYNKPELHLSGDAQMALQQYLWPGNVRELAHVVERAAILTNENIDADVLGLIAKQPAAHFRDLLTRQDLTLDDVEKRVIQSRLEQYQGNSLKAAESLGLSKSAFYRHVKKHNLN